MPCLQLTASHHPVAMLTTSSRSHSTSRTTSPAAAACAPLPGTAELHKQFGRDTALGRQMFALYNNAKLTYDPDVQLICRQSDPHLEHQHAAHVTNSHRRQQLTRYRTITHNVRKRTDEERQEWKRQLLDAAGRKRSEQDSMRAVAEIEKERKEMAEERRGLQVPSAEERKRQLQERMSGLAAMREKVHREKQQREEKEQLRTTDRPHPQQADEVDELVREIDERQVFLAEMRRNGRGEEFDAAIQAEIAQLMHQLSLHDQ